MYGVYNQYDVDESNFVVLTDNMMLHSTTGLPGTWVNIFPSPAGEVFVDMTMGVDSNGKLIIGVIDSGGKVYVSFNSGLSYLNSSTNGVTNNAKEIHYAWNDTATGDNRPMFIVVGNNDKLYYRTFQNLGVTSNWSVLSGAGSVSHVSVESVLFGNSHTIFAHYNNTIKIASAASITSWSSYTHTVGDVVKRGTYVYDNESYLYLCLEPQNPLSNANIIRYDMSNNTSVTSMSNTSANLDHIESLNGYMFSYRMKQSGGGLYTRANKGSGAWVNKTFINGACTLNIRRVIFANGAYIATGWVSGGGNNNHVVWKATDPTGVWTSLYGPDFIFWAQAATGNHGLLDIAYSSKLDCFIGGGTSMYRMESDGVTWVNSGAISTGWARKILCVE